ncbi:EF-hand domain-containing protein [Gemmobacter denitrificans]|uniref:Calcium-binding protein n=1 Tax=Gemmobacter denitrificans TaxID=3123040 RepID=A0ABU8BXQ9_9RHOB
MQKRNIAYTLAVTALLVGGLGSAALADKAREHGGEGGPMGMMMMGGPLAQFDVIDTDKDGKLSPDEMAAHRAARVAEMDGDKDGKISAAELEAAHLKMANDMAKTRSARMMERLDGDKDGTLTVAEMQEQMGKGPGRKMMKHVDADGDGALSRAELEAARDWMMKRGHKRGHGFGDEG